VKQAALVSLGSRGFAGTVEIIPWNGSEVPEQRDIIAEHGCPLSLAQNLDLMKSNHR